MQGAESWLLLHIETQRPPYGSVSNWAHGMQEALITMGGQPSYMDVTVRPPHPIVLFFSAGADIIFNEF